MHLIYAFQQFRVCTVHGVAGKSKILQVFGAE